MQRNVGRGGEGATPPRESKGFEGPQAERVNEP